MSSQHSLTPDWILWVLSFAAAGGTGAFFHYLAGKNKYSALWSAYITLVFVLLAVSLLVRNDWIKKDQAGTADVIDLKGLPKEKIDEPATTPGSNSSTEEATRSPVAESDSPVTQRPVVPPSQTIINSPGAIQAGRDVNIVADPQLIKSIELRISIRTTTSPKTPGPEEYDFGLGSVVALFTSSKERFRFASDMKVYDQQISDNYRRIRFVYQPEDPPQILGRPISLLGSFEVLALNFTEILKTLNVDTSLGETALECGVIVNGLPLARVVVALPQGVWNKEQANIDVREAFGKIPEAYSAALKK